ncbi:hypothetical protein FHG66_20280 [Rubellimicrobium rubrum]|uniref:Uncharacterized protein n=1 Tax=Rubellimicrobium rubrum TaxID=2585369 RepID=A0A5C4MKS8_9RHOB|nr:hypothetical protein [Rubellimicrobium rubrum]TNC45133.1 hypothetical protein FHG66_20280 [Rubellimicrobium rubrum]
MTHSCTALLSTVLIAAATASQAQDVLADLQGYWSGSYGPPANASFDVMLLGAVGEITLDVPVPDEILSANCRYILAVEPGTASGSIDGDSDGGCPDAMTFAFRDDGADMLVLEFLDGPLAQGLEGVEEIAVPVVLRPLAEAETPSGFVAPDILGVRPGMTAAEAEAILSDKGYALQEPQLREGEGFTVTDLNWVRNEGQEWDTVGLGFTAQVEGDGAEPRIMRVSRSWTMTSETGVTVSSLRDSLTTKYGTPNGIPSNEDQPIWVFDRAGNRPEVRLYDLDCGEVPAFSLPGGMVGSWSMQEIPVSCLAIVGADIQPSFDGDGLAGRLDMDVLDLDLMLADFWATWRHGNVLRIEADKQRLGSVVTPEL